MESGSSASGRGRDRSSTTSGSPRRRSTTASCACIRPLRLHGPRPLPSPHGAEDRPVETSAPALHVVVHSEHGRETLAEFGVDPGRCASSRTRAASDPRRRRDDGATVLSLGVIRSYKGLGDTIAAVGTPPDARLLVVGDPAEPAGAVPGYRGSAGRNGASDTRRRTRSTGHSARRRLRSSRTSRRSTRRGAACARSARVCPSSPTTSVASPSRCASSRPDASFRPATWTRSALPSASCSPTDKRSSARAVARVALATR